MPQTIIDLLKNGAHANKADRFRKGNVVCLPAKGNLVVTGDLHGHRRNFERITAFADLNNNPDRHMVLQELIHGGLADLQGNCLSYRLLFDAVQYKLDFPDRVHFIMGNHDTAFITNGKVMKDGREMNYLMSLALEKEFGADSDKIKQAIKDLLVSQPLAIKCDNRIWLSHSLPADGYIDKFDSQIFNRILEINDLVKPGSGYLLTWGRKHSQKTLDEIAKLLDVDIFILGHQPQQQGWVKAGQNLIIITSEHNHGCLLLIDLTKSYGIEQLVDSIVPLASIS